MKKSLKILIISTIVMILLGTTTVVCAYWTDMVASKINLVVTYDANIKVSNVSTNK